MTQKLLAANIISIYKRHADAFRRLRSTDLFEKIWLDRFLALIPKQGSILDIGCGNGVPIAPYFLSVGFQVEGIDSSETMISYCQERFPDQCWHIDDMRGLHLDKKFHGLIAWDSFFHLTQDDQRNMFSIFSQHALAGAALMFTSGLNKGEAIGSFENEPLYHASLDHEEYNQLLIDNGFNVIKKVIEDPKCRDRTVWLAKKC